MVALNQIANGHSQREILKRLDWVLQKAELGEDRLSEWERRFVDDMAHRRASYGDGISISDRQWEILEAIAERAAT